MKPKRHLFIPPFLFVAASLLAVFSVTAVAVNFLGLRDLLLPEKQVVNAIDSATDAVIPEKTWKEDTISLSGYTDSPESKALIEWQNFLKEYDKDNTILNRVGNTLNPALDKYDCYFVYTQDMADKLEEIVSKYALKLHTDQIDLCAHPETLGSLAEFSKEENETYWTYMYEDGSCHFDGFAQVEDWGLVDVQFQRSVKGVFHDVTLNVGDAAEYQQWQYKTSSGVETVLALGQGKSAIFADFPDCFASFHVLTGTDGEMTRERLEAVADCYDFSKLSPVEKPEVIPNAVGLSVPAGERTNARYTYADVLRDLLYHSVLPDGTEISSSEEFPDFGNLSKNQFTVCDVDGDSEEELVLLYTNAPMASMTGYVVNFDPTYTGTATPIFIQLTEFPAWTFYDNGMVKAEASHNQTWGELWPYVLYGYDAASDMYYEIASVHAVDRARMEESGNADLYPSDVDISGAGSVYSVTFPYSSGVTPAGERLWDQTTYDEWLAETLGDAKPLQLSWLTLTEDHIASCLGGNAPVQTTSLEGISKG